MVLLKKTFNGLVSVNKCGGSCNTIDGLSDKTCVPNKMEAVNLKVFNMVKGTNELKRLLKRISGECSC